MLFDKREDNLTSFIFVTGIRQSIVLHTDEPFILEDIENCGDFFVEDLIGVDYEEKFRQPGIYRWEGELITKDDSTYESGPSYYTEYYTRRIIKLNREEINEVFKMVV